MNLSKSVLFCALVAISLAARQSATISDVQLTVSNSTDSIDIQQGRKQSIEYGKKLNSAVKVEYFQHLYLDFRVKAGGKDIDAQQAFVRLFNEKLGREYTAVGKSNGKGYTAHLNIREAANEFYGQSGDYQLQLIVGDASIANPTQWTIGTININYPSELWVEVPRSPFAVLPEITHLFRQAEKRPPAAISSAFTIAVIAIPALVLFIGLIRVGANLSNFPTGGNFIWAIGFQGCVGAILALYGFYWLSLNMIQTLTYLAILLIPTLFFAHKNLNALSRGKLHAE
jgi:oligosaccharyltransferase complex subunit delta (ribophorin II)